MNIGVTNNIMIRNNAVYGKWRVHVEIKVWFEVNGPNGCNNVVVNGGQRLLLCDEYVNNKSNRCADIDFKPFE